ncbi:hypothetical protein [Vibrio phage vB_VpaS_CHI]|nr:hypothetical protein [Vibrio phage vB_VpaS_ALK]USL90069.1 hypothetical protein [Vibrio phage vB_VpaS_CHI]
MYNQKPINNTYSTEAFGLSVSLMAPCTVAMMGFELTNSNTVATGGYFSGEIFLMMQEEPGNLDEAFWKGFIMEINGVRIDNLIFVQANKGFSKPHLAEVAGQMFGEWGQGYTIHFQAFEKTPEQRFPMDIAKALVEDKLMGANPGVGAIYTREVMERVLADFLNDGAIEVTTNKSASVKPWDK